MKVFTVALTVALVVGCSPAPNPVDPAPTSDCEGACHQFNVFGCEEGKPSQRRGSSAWHGVPSTTLMNTCLHSPSAQARRPRSKPCELAE